MVLNCDIHLKELQSFFIAHETPIRVSKLDEETRVANLNYELALLKERQKLQHDIDLLERTNEILLDEFEPDWESESWGTFLLGALTTYELTGCINNDNVQYEIFMEQSGLRICDRPFSFGNFRSVYHAQFAWETSSTRRIAKIQLDLSMERKACEMDIEIHLLASYYAQEFNKALGEEYLEYSKIMLFDATEAPFLCDENGKFESSCMIIEQPILNFTKYNNNYGYTSKGNTKSATAQAFSHFSWQKSNETLMIVDIQGGKKATGNGYLLSDPAAHHVDKTKFGDTNHGTKGFDEFFRTHECNSICEELELRQSPIQNQAYDYSGTVLRSWR